MKKHWKVAVMAMMMVLLMGLTGCDGYVSSFKATMCVTTNTSKHASLSFSTLEGSKVLKMKVNKDAEGVLEYSGKLGGGSATVYYDDNGTKKELFSIGAGEKVEQTLNDLEQGKLYVIIETDGKCENGDFTFEVK